MNAETRAKIEAERAYQVEKWGRGQFKHTSKERCLAVLIAEVGEVAKAVLEYRSAGTEQEAARHIEEELVQVAAVAARWLDTCFSEEGERE